MPDNKYLFDDIGFIPDWRSEWKDMPEFERIQEYVYQKIVVRFKTKDDVKTFANLIKQNISERTDSIWFPPQTRKTGLYIDES